ncbi:MAG: metallophosphoesterase [Myxococcota bacterium]|nr:metallophosphoesterase [Myxococcota bacterium]
MKSKFNRIGVIGDPQTTFEQFLSVLKHHDLLCTNAELRPDVGLITIGDYFDFGRDGVALEQAQLEGVKILEWLMAHPREQVVMIMGNHDVCRVMELYRMTDAAFSDARAVADQGDEDTFFKRFPDLPALGVAQRDFSAFTVRQRRLVQTLLLQRRFRLACVGLSEFGHPVLVTHAGVTNRELDLLGCHDLSPKVIARALNDFLDRAVDAVADAWRQGEAAALDLTPLHYAGRPGLEGRGLLYHRPTTKSSAARGPDGALRRFNIHDLPKGLHQVCGHTQHKKCQKLMPELAAHLDPNYGALRTLTVSTDGPSYGLGALEPNVDDACLWMVDSGLNYWPADSVEILKLNSFETALSESR